ncbi:type II CAAX endopeptidase family protein [Rhodococcus sp. X156]|uniref:CPBP family intramembrane glutamic endopeptidase n=1 Tax=Rhodococcus sp. X156 TaxID=2499145 RepID=UPI000FD7158D|nr:type II CAAX endopeptidase family protein [Rhodococcus sp. X156]
MRIPAPAWLTERVPRDHWEPDAAFARRRKVVGAVSVAGAGLLGVSLSTEPGSPEFYGLTLAVAATYTAGGLASGPLHRGWARGPDGALHRPVLVPVLVGAGAFGVFYAAALVARHVPVLDRAISSVLQYSDEGADRLVLLTTLANGVAEEVFYRGAVFAALGAGALGTGRPVLATTAVYTLATCATRNPALVLASTAMGTLFALQRRATGGIQAPMISHVTWSALMLRHLPPLFGKQSSGLLGPGARVSSATPSSTTLSSTTRWRAGRTRLR